MIAKVFAWLLLVLIVLVGSGWLLADWLTPRAVGEPSAALPVREGETALDRAIEPLLAEHPGQNGAALLIDGFDAFAVRAATAAAAGRSLDLQYYIWRDDVTGHLLGREVWRAAERGVRVRMLLDDLTIRGADRKLLALASHANIEIRVYNPVRNRGGVLRVLEMIQRSLSLNYRMHNKAWIADGRVAIMGGRNIGVEYFSASTDANFHDLDAALVGPVVAQASAIFDQFWNSDAVVPITALVRQPRMDLETYLAGIDLRDEDEIAQSYLARVARSTRIRDWFEGEAEIYWGESMRLQSDPPVKRGQPVDEHWLVHHLNEQLVQVQEEALLISPYFVPGVDFSNWLQARAGEGIEIGVITNSLAATDVLAVHSGYARYRRPLLGAGVRLFELRRQPDQGSDGSLFGSSGASLHSKGYVLDGRMGFLGSFNLDPRSAWLNTEMGLLFEHEGLAQAIRREYQHLARPQMSYEVEVDENGGLRWQDRLVSPPRVLDGEPDSGRGRRAAARVLGWLPIESQL